MAESISTEADAVILLAKHSLTIRRMMYISWLDIGFQYDGLTSIEKGVISRETFEELAPLAEISFDGEEGEAILKTIYKRRYEQEEARNKAKEEGGGT